jgi:hypothetical protein
MHPNAAFRCEDRPATRGWRGSRTLGQNKPAAARMAAADGDEAAGRRAIAHLMRTLP